MTESLKLTASLLRTLGNETRLRILRALAGRELCVCELVDALRIPQPGHDVVDKPASFMVSVRFDLAFDKRTILLFDAFFNADVR